MADSDMDALTNTEAPAGTSSPPPTSPTSPVCEDPTSIYIHSISYLTNVPDAVSRQEPEQPPPNIQYVRPVSRTRPVNRSTSAPLSFLNTIHPTPCSRITAAVTASRVEEGRPVSVTAWTETPSHPTVIMDLHVPINGMCTKDKSIKRTQSFLQNIRTLFTSGPFSSASPVKDEGEAAPSYSRYALRRSSSCGDDLATKVIIEGKDTSAPLFMTRTLSEPALVNLYFNCIVPSSTICQSPVTEVQSYPVGHSCLASRSSSVEERLCRICWGGDELETCIQPCYCSTAVHESCMQKWLQLSNSSQCEVCQYRFTSKVTLKPLSEWRWWLNKNRNMAQLEATILLLGIVTPPLLCGIILCSQKIAEYLTDPNNAWKTAGLMTLVLISVVTYLAAMIYFLIKFGTVCKLWLAVNRTTVIHLVPLTDSQRRPWLHAVSLDRGEPVTVLAADAATDARVWSIS